MLQACVLEWLVCKLMCDLLLQRWCMHVYCIVAIEVALTEGMKL
jgi:hypothetical protein